MKTFVTALTALAFAAVAAAAEPGIEDLVTGDGRAATRGDVVDVHYTGWLADGTKFDSSRDRDEPFSFRLGARQVIAGWEIGIEGMRAGGKRRLTLPPEFAYGSRDLGIIPPNSTLIFEVELLAIR